MHEVDAGRLDLAGEFFDRPQGRLTGNVSDRFADVAPFPFPT